jgi:DNA (cytosine-5)-methyltransferase 1
MDSMSSLPNLVQVYNQIYTCTSMGMGGDCMKALSLFSGIGGIDLASEWAGIETVAFCEREPFCQKVLKKHWPDTPIYDDVCTLTKERLEADGIETGPIGLIHGGYPCQPFSLAGKREGTSDDRHLWPEVKRLLQELQPRWFVGENVAGHITLGLDQVLDDLGSIDYTAQAFVIPACSVGADHRRERVFIIANSNKEFGQWSAEKQVSGIEDVQIEFQRGYSQWSGRWDVSRPRVRRAGHGIPNYVDRVGALGNAVVPAQIYPILAAIKQIDEQWRANG